MDKIKALSDSDLAKQIKGAKLVISSSTGLIKDASEKKLAKLETELASRSGKSAEKPKKVTAKAKKPVKQKKEKKSADKSPKVEKPKKEKPKSPSPTDDFQLTIDGKVYKFSDLASKEECERATKAVKARYEEVKANKEARKEGMERAASTPITHRISDNFVSATKKAVSAISETKIDKSPEVLKKEINALEKAFNNLFDRLGDLMGKKIPDSQRKEIMDVLNKFESKLDKPEKKAEGGLAGSTNADKSEWSYTKFLN